MSVLRPVIGPVAAARRGARPGPGWRATRRTRQAQHPVHPRGRPGTARFGQLRQHVLRDAAPRPPCSRRRALHRSVCGRAGVLAHPGQPPDRAMAPAHQHHRLHRRGGQTGAVEAQYAGAARTVRRSAGAQRDDDCRGAQGRRVCDVLCRQVASRAGGRVARGTGFRPESRRHGSRRTVWRQAVFLPVWQSPPARRSRRRTPARSPGDRDGALHRREPGASLLRLPVVLRCAHAADGATRSPA